MQNKSQALAMLNMAALYEERDVIPAMAGVVNPQESTVPYANATWAAPSGGSGTRVQVGRGTPSLHVPLGPSRLASTFPRGFIEAQV